MSVKSDWMIHILHTILMWFIVIKLMNNYLPKELLQLISIIDKYILLNAGVFLSYHHLLLFSEKSVTVILAVSLYHTFIYLIFMAYFSYRLKPIFFWLFLVCWICSVWMSVCVCLLSLYTSRTLWLTRGQCGSGKVWKRLKPLTTGAGRPPKPTDCGREPISAACDGATRRCATDGPEDTHRKHHWVTADRPLEVMEETPLLNSNTFSLCFLGVLIYVWMLRQYCA